MEYSIQTVKEHTCAFTGHRPEAFPFGDNEASPECVAIKEKLAAEIEKMIAKGVDTFISGAAKGVDTWAMEAVLELRETKYPHIKMIAAIPYPSQSKSWSDEEKQRYERLTAASVKAVLSEKYYRGCLLVRNRVMVDSSDHLIAVYNGAEKGGTAYTVKYARKLGKDTVIIDI